MDNKPVYLDYNATAPLKPQIKAAMDEVLGEPLNPSSIHSSGRKARKLVEDARQKILQRVSGEALVFCDSGTEANNLALGQIGRTENGERKTEIIVSAIEHDSIFKVENPIIINVNKNGVVDVDDLKSKLSVHRSPLTVLVSIMLANNETGVIQPIRDIAKIAHQYGALVHTDAVQAFGKIDIDFKELGVDMMTISCHKIGGPVGAAALVHRAGLELKPIMFGGGQEKNKRPGTENVAAIAGFGKLAENVSRETFVVSGERKTENGKEEEKLFTVHRSPFTEYLESEIKKFAPDAVIFGENSPRLPNTTCIAMPEIEAATQLIHFDTSGICISTGSACSSGKVEDSRVLKAMNAPLAKNAIRVSTGWATSKADMDKFIKSWRELYLRAKNAAA